MERYTLENLVYHTQLCLGYDSADNSKAWFKDKAARVGQYYYNMLNAHDLEIHQIRFDTYYSTPSAPSLQFLELTNSDHYQFFIYKNGVPKVEINKYQAYCVLFFYEF